jgi:hypothetical protein
MTSRDRILAAIEGRPTDHVPLTAQNPRTYQLRKLALAGYLTK